MHINSVDNFQANYNHDPGAPIPIERLVKNHSYELLEILLRWVQEIFAESKTPISYELTQAISTAQTKSDPSKVAEIRRTFLAEGKIHHAQHLFKLSERMQSLEAERSMLHRQLEQMHQ